MSFLALVLALALEQWRPLVDRRAVFAPVVGYAGYLERQFNAGEANQGAVAWLLAAVPLAVAAWAVYALLDALNPIAGLLFNIAVLYATMGFREHSHYFTGVHKALKEGDLAEARRLLGEWRGHPCDALSASEVARLAIEGAFTVSHRHVFAAMFWFLLLPGPSGAVLYRTALFLSRRWGRMARAGEPGPVFELGGAEAEAGPARRGRRAAGLVRRVRPPRVLRARLAAGAVHRGVIRDRRRLRGRGLLLAHAGCALARPAARHRPRRRRRRARGSPRPADRARRRRRGPAGARSGRGSGYAVPRFHRGADLAGARAVARAAAGGQRRRGVLGSRSGVSGRDARRRSSSTPRTGLRFPRRTPGRPTTRPGGGGRRQTASSASARGRSSSRTRCSSIAHSVNGISPASRERSSFLIQQPMPSASSTFLRWWISSALSEERSGFIASRLRHPGSGAAARAGAPGSPRTPPPRAPRSRARCDGGSR